MMRENVMKEDKIHGKYCFKAFITWWNVWLVSLLSSSETCLGKIKEEKPLKIKKLNGNELKKTFIQSKKLD